MLTIAGGIIIAVVVLSFLPEIILGGTALALFLLAISAVILVYQNIDILWQFLLVGAVLWGLRYWLLNLEDEPREKLANVVEKVGNKLGTVLAVFGTVAVVFFLLFGIFAIFQGEWGLAALFLFIILPAIVGYFDEKEQNGKA